MAGFTEASFNFILNGLYENIDIKVLWEVEILTLEQLIPSSDAMV